MGYVAVKGGQDAIANANELVEYYRLKGRIEPGSRVAGLYIAPDVARPVTHIIDRDGVLRETLIAGQSYESFERTIKPYL